MRSNFEQSRRLFTALALPYQIKHDENVQADQLPQTSPALITMEEIEAVLPGGFYRVKGASIPASGSVVLQAGQIVPVAWRKGRPVVILQHNVRRAEMLSSIETSVGVVQELLLLKVNGVWDVWFRDATIFAALGVSQFVNHDGTSGPEFETAPVLIRWGQNSNSFVVLTRYVVVKPSGQGPVTVSPPRFYVFRLNGHKATLANIFSPPVVDSGLPLPLSGLTRYIPDFALDVILLEASQNFRVFFLTTPLGENNNPVWVMDESGNVVSTLSGLNGFGPNTADGTTSTQTLIFQPMFLSWSLTSEALQLILAERRHVVSTIVDNGADFSLSGSNLREYMIFQGSAAGVPVFPSQSGSWSYTSPSSGGSPSYPPDDGSEMGVTDDLIFQGGGSGTLSFSGGFGKGGAAKFMITSDFIGVPLSLPNPNIPGVSGGFRTGFTVGLTSITVNNPKYTPTSTIPLATGALNVGYYRWLRPDVLYTAQVSVGALPSDPTVPAPTQRGIPVIFADAHDIPKIVFYPTGQLKVDTRFNLAKLKAWLKTFPPADGQNTTSEAALASDVSLTAYRLT